MKIMENPVDLSFPKSPKLRGEGCISQEEAREVDRQTQKRSSEQSSETKKAIENHPIVEEVKKTLTRES